MAIPFLPITALALGSLALSSAPSASGELPNRLQPYKWYRIRFTFENQPFVPSPNLTDAQNKAAEGLKVIFDHARATEFLKNIGFEKPIYIALDPRDGKTGDAFARFVGPAPSDLKKSGIVRADEILNTNPKAPTIPILPWKLFDRREPSANGPMPQALMETVSFAVTHDDDEKRVKDFSISLLPEFPSASYILDAKSNALKLARKDRYSIGPIINLNVPKQTPKQASVGAFWDVIGDIAEGVFSVTPVGIIYQAGRAVIEGENVIDYYTDIGRKVLEVVQTAAPFIQMGVSFIPGIGTVASAAIGAGVALASGRPITDAVIAAAKGAFPGGPIAANAVEAGVRTVAGLAQGQSLDVALVEAARKSISQEPALLAAFDTGVALAQGKNIQDAAIAGVRALSPEAGTVLGAIADGKPLDAGLLAQAAAARAGLPREAQAAFGAVTELAKTGNIRDAATSAATIAVERAKVPPQARASFDAAVAIIQKKDPTQAAIDGAQALAPKTPEAQVAFDTTRAALRGEPTPATLSGEATKFIPNLPENRGINPAQITAEEAQRISNLGVKAFTSPELYLPAKERNRAVIIAQKAIQAEGVRSIVREKQLADRLAQEERTKLRNSWIPKYQDLKRVAERGGIPDFKVTKTVFVNPLKGRGS